MKFEESIAMRLIEQHGLSKSILAVWRLRGAIPDGYKNENYSPHPKEGYEQDSEKIARIKRFLQLPFISAASMDAHCSYSRKIQDFMQGKASLLEGEAAKIHREIEDFVSAANHLLMGDLDDDSGRKDFSRFYENPLSTRKKIRIFGAEYSEKIYYHHQAETPFGARLQKVIKDSVRLMLVEIKKKG